MSVIYYISCVDLAQSLKLSKQLCTDVDIGKDEGVVVQEMMVELPRVIQKIQKIPKITNAFKPPEFSWLTTTDLFSGLNSDT